MSIVLRIVQFAVTIFFTMNRWQFFTIVITVTSPLWMMKFTTAQKTETAVEDHKMILEACHCYPTSGHFGITKTEKNIGTLLLETIVQRCEGIGKGIQVF